MEVLIIDFDVNNYVILIFSLNLKGLRFLKIITQSTILLFLKFF